MKFINIEDLPGKVPAKHYDLLGRVFIDDSVGVKDFRCAFSRMEKTGRCDPHVHEEAEQIFIVLKGAMMFVSDEGERPVTQGQAVIVYRGEIHSNYNIADVETEYLTVTSLPRSQEKR